MSQINGIYIHVTNESVSRSVDVSTHSVEQGTDITDTTKKKPRSLSISGKIVNYKNNGKEYKASDVISMLEDLHNKGKIVTYIGRNWEGNVQIVNFDSDHPNTVNGGAEFSMELQERRFAKNAYVEPKKGSSVKNGGEKQVEKGDSKEVWYTVKKGDCVAALVAEPNAPYKNLKREGAKSGYWGACNWVMEKNQKAFSRAGDFRTLQIGKKILLGSKN